jgi:hypothetical protein
MIDRLPPLIAFDIDDTIGSKEESSEYVNGPIPVPVLLELAKSCVIVMVSPSPYYPKDAEGKSIFPRCCEYGSDTMRHVNLEAARQYYVNNLGMRPQLKLYVSNNGDYKEAEKAGFIYIDAVMFDNGFPNTH